MLRVTSLPYRRMYYLTFIRRVLVLAPYPRILRASLLGKLIPNAPGTTSSRDNPPKGPTFGTTGTAILVRWVCLMKLKHPWPLQKSRAMVHLVFTLTPPPS